MKRHSWLRSKKFGKPCCISAARPPSPSNPQFLERKAIANFCCTEFSKAPTWVVPSTEKAVPQTAFHGLLHDPGISWGKAFAPDSVQFRFRPCQPNPIVQKVR